MVAGPPGSSQNYLSGGRSRGLVEEFRLMMRGYAYHGDLGLEEEGVILGNGTAWIEWSGQVAKVVEGYEAILATERNGGKG